MLNHFFPIWLWEASSEIRSHQKGQDLLTGREGSVIGFTFGKERQKFRSYACHNLVMLLFLPQKPGEEW